MEGLKGLTNVSMLLDGGHTMASLKASADWWIGHVKDNRTYLYIRKQKKRKEKKRKQI